MAAPQLCGRFRLCGRLGDGASAEVLLAARDNDGAVFALKRFKTNALVAARGDAAEAAALLSRANSEYSLLAALQHAHV